ncbi:protein CEBPZOS [Drosophila grimshawi]|uniref:GH11467 n=1 Tax=Drosophila grimshawi TaxID=7222 RepID=B4JAP7_DROGR|nr:protein CEBPZOS [Drosophila grimshawi]XP_043070417.1 protein CEBPZOS [Drosophila grimshawi]EDW03855.1 GH11467 [Drosophila grimshawi]
MLPKTPKPAIWRFIKGSAKTLFVLEAVCFAASYGLYYRMNTDQDFRRYVNEKYPYALEYYYKIGELVGDNTVRETDANYWSSTAAQFGKKQ